MPMHKQVSEAESTLHCLFVLILALKCREPLQHVASSYLEIASSYLESLRERVAVWLAHKRCAVF